MADWVENLSPKEREQWDAWVRHVRDEADIRFAVQLGLAILLYKPIVVDIDTEAGQRVLAAKLAAFADGLT